MSASTTVKEKIAHWSTTNERHLRFSETDIRNGYLLIISGDGILKFSHLIASGLADYTIVSVSNQTILYMPFPTDKGSRIADAGGFRQ